MSFSGNCLQNYPAVFCCFYYVDWHNKCESCGFAHKAKSNQSMDSKFSFETWNWNSSFMWYFWFCYQFNAVIHINVNEVHALLPTIQPYIGFIHLKGMNANSKPTIVKAIEWHESWKIKLKSVYKYVAKASRTYSSCVVSVGLCGARPIDSSKCCTGCDKIRKQGRKFNQSRKRKKGALWVLFVRVCACVCAACVYVMKLTTLVLKRVLTKAIVYYLFFGLIHIYWFHIIHFRLYLI